MRPSLKNKTTRSLVGLLSLATLYFLANILAGNVVAPTDILELSPLTSTDGKIQRQSVAYDVVYEFIPWQTRAHHLFTNATFPLWNAYQGLGAPLFANFQSALLNPINWLYVATGNPLFGFFSYWLKLIIASAGMFFLARYLGITIATSCLGAIAFTYSGAVIGWLTWPNSSVFVLIPCATLFCLSILSDKPGPWFLLFATTIALSILGGHPGSLIQVAFFLSVITLTFIILNRASRRSSTRPLLKLFASGCLGAGVSAIQWIPTVEYILKSTAIDRVLSRSSHLQPEYLAINFFPDLIGNYHLVNMWFAQSKEVPEISMGYVGVTMVLFALVAVLHYPHSHSRPNNKTIFFVAGLVAIILTYQIPGLSHVVDNIPILSSSGYHRMQVFWGVCIIVLGMYGIDSVFFHQDVKHRILVIAVSVVTLSGMLLFVFSAPYFFERSSYQAPYQKYLGIVFLLFLGNVAAIASALLIRKYSWSILAISSIVLCETFFHAYGYLDADDQESFYSRSPGITFLQKASSNYRMFALNHQILPADLGSYYGINQVRVYDPMMPKNAVLVGRHQRSGDAALLHLLRRLGVKHYVAPTPAPGSPAITSIHEFFGEVTENANDFSFAYHGEQYSVFEDKRVWPRAYILEQGNYSRSLNSHYVVRRDGRWSELAEFTYDYTGRARLTGQCHSTCLIVLSDTFFPGWDATNNDKTTIIEAVQPIDSTHVTVRGIVVESGQFDIQYIYRPLSFKIGLAVTVLSILLGITLIISFRRRQTVSAPISN